MRTNIGFLLGLALLAAPAVCRGGSDPLKVTPTAPFRYVRSFRAASGTIYVLGPFKTVDAGKTLWLSGPSDPPWGTLLKADAMNTLFSRKGLFLALQTKVICGPAGECKGKMWRSFDDLKTFQEAETRVLIPEAGKVDNGKSGEWAGNWFRSCSTSGVMTPKFSATIGNSPSAF